MSILKQTAFRVSEETLEGLRRVRQRDGTLLSEQVRRALGEWLVARGIDVSGDSRRAAGRFEVRPMRTDEAEEIGSDKEKGDGR